MSHFYGSLQGSRGEATRCGTAWSGVTCHVRGWHVGTEATAHVDADGSDAVRLVATRGSAGYGGEAIGSVRLDDSGSLVLEPSAWTLAQVQAWQRAERKRLRLERKAAEHEARRERYRKLRTEHERYPASTAWHYASQAPAPALDWTEDGYGWTAKLVERGYSVSVVARADYDPDYWTRGKFQNGWTPDAVALPEPRERGTYAYFVPDMPYREHVAGLRKLGYARHEADCLARQYVAADLRTAIHGREAVYVVATAYAAGVELGTSSIGGCELDTSSRAESVERQLDAIVSDYGLVSEAVSEAVAARAKLVRTEVA